MDISVYSIKTISDDLIKQLVDQRRSFVLEDIDRLNLGESVASVEKIIESRGLKCRVYLKGRLATVGALAIPIAPTVIGAWASAIAIGVHNLATWSPDYEIAKNPATGTLTVTYKK